MIEMATRSKMKSCIFLSVLVLLFLLPLGTHSFILYNAQKNVLFTFVIVNNGYLVATGGEYWLNSATPNTRNPYPYCVDFSYVLPEGRLRCASQDLKGFLYTQANRNMDGATGSQYGYVGWSTDAMHTSTWTLEAFSASQVRVYAQSDTKRYITLDTDVIGGTSFLLKVSAHPYPSEEMSVFTVKCNGNCVNCLSNECRSLDGFTCTDAATARTCIVLQCPSGTFNSSSSTCTPCTSVPGCTSSLTCTGPATSVCSACSRCTACSPIKNCIGQISCTSANDSTCPACQVGHYGNNTNACIACSPIKNCIGQISCTSANDSTCPACQAGHYGNNTNACIACTPIPNAAKNATVTCTSSAGSFVSECAQGHYKSGNETYSACPGNFKFNGFSL
eukprot:Colp12_sorted_trinity150504_noHs@12500